MICPREEALSCRHDGELKGQELARLEAHLSGCAVCREFERKLHMLDHLLTSRLPPTAAARARLRHGPRTTVWFAAASLVALLAVFGVANRVSRPRKPSGTSVVNYQLVSPQGGTYHISVQGQAELLSIEVNGTIAHFDKETLP